MAGLAVHPTKPGVVYAAVDGKGIYRTTNGGTSWTPRGLTNLHVTTISIDPTHPRTLYAGVEPGGVYRSLDGGATWHAFNVGLGIRSVMSTAVSADGKRVYAGTNGGSVADYRFPWGARRAAGRLSVPSGRLILLVRLDDLLRHVGRHFLVMSEGGLEDAATTGQ